MCHIVGELSKYVPSRCGDTEEHPRQCKLFFGDQLTAEQARGAMVLRSLHEHAIDRLEGFVPTIADWHARMTLVKVLPINAWLICFHRCINRLFGTNCIRGNPHVIREHFTNSGI